jgi:hypothetical protein
MFYNEIVCRESSVLGSSVRGYGSMVEPQPSKLKMRVRFPLPAPFSWHGYEKYGFWRFGVIAHIAQSVEHFLGKEEVIGSNPIVSTKVRECSGVSGCMNKRGRANLHC